MGMVFVLGTCSAQQTSLSSLLPKEMLGTNLAHVPKHTSEWDKPSHTSFHSFLPLNMLRLLGGGFSDEGSRSPWKS